MEIVIDTSAILAVIAGEPEREAIIRLTAGNTLIGPGSIPWEVGNAFTSMLKQRRIGEDEAQRGLAIYQGIPIRLVGVDLQEALTLAARLKCYAYDAYFIVCALRQAAPLLTLDRPMARMAASAGAKLMEV